MLFAAASPGKSSFTGKTALICGGSKGIGREMGLEIVRRGGSVCLLARHEEPLLETAQAARGLAGAGQVVEIIVGDATNMEQMRSLLDAYIGRRGVPDYLINAVGYAYPQYLEKLTLEDFRRNMEVNYYGQLVPILVLLPHLMAARRGHIVNIISILGHLGMVGYATYAPTKGALYALSDTLRHELKPYNIRVSVCYPPDTDTPGFAVENQTKPPETKWISGHRSRVYSAEEVALDLVNGIEKGRFEIFAGDQGLLRLAGRLFPGIVRFILDRDYTQARKLKNAET